MYQAEKTGSSLLKKLLPLAAIALLIWFGWQMFAKKPQETVVPPAAVERPVANSKVEVGPKVELSPEVMQMPTNLRETYTAATAAISNITDLTSAQAALPKLNELNEKLNGLVALWEKLPATAKSTISEITRNNIGKLEALIRPILAIPGVADTLAPVFKEILEKLHALKDAA